MSKLVVFTLLGGDLNQGFPVVTAQLWHQNQIVKITGSLPAAPELNKLQKRWQQLYEAVHQRLGSNQRIRVRQNDITNVSINDFYEVCQQLQANINAWLKFHSFQNIERQLRTQLNQDDEIRIIIETNIVVLHRLPWHLWNFFDDYPQAELGLSNHEYGYPRVSRKSATGKVKILAVLGNRVGIDIDKDSSLLAALTDAQTTFLVEPSRKELDEQLWNYDWDILFFAGHSVSSANGEIGKIYINQIESLTIFQLKNALKTAIKRGLSVAIFNSCDGIGLARNLADLNIPQMVVMRMGVPDLIAQEFLKNFLTAFAGTKPFYLALREARERLQGLENEFPCASWLPVIYQNPTTIPTTWQELRENVRGNQSATRILTQGKISSPISNTSPPKSKILSPVSEISSPRSRTSFPRSRTSFPRSKSSFPISKLLILLLSIVFGTLSTIGLRYLRIFQNIELQAFDHMLLQRPKEDFDQRIVVVEVTEKDIQSRQDTTLGLKSISDSTLAKLLSKVQEHQPRVIGLDIYRDFVEPPGSKQDNSDRIHLSTEFAQGNLVVVCKGRDSQYDAQGVRAPEEVPVERQGFSDAIQDPDGIVRRLILRMAQDGSSACQTPNSLSLQLATGYLYYENIIPNFDSADYVKFGSKVFKGLRFGRSGAYQLGVDLGGIQILVNYPNADYERVSLEDVLSNRISLDLFKDKVVLIGVTANTINDTWSTPYSSAEQTYQETPGVLIQAQMVSQILSAVLDDRPIFWVLPFWGDIIWISGWYVLGTIIVWRFRSLSGKAFAIVGTVVVLYGVCTIALLTQGLWAPFIPSAFGVGLGGVVVLFIQHRREFSTTPQYVAGNDAGSSA